MKRQYRVKVKWVEWMDKFYHFPQEKIGWFPIWFNFDDGMDEDVYFVTEEEAWDWLERIVVNFKTRV